MSAHSPNPILSSEEVQRIIDERLEVILGKESGCSFFRRIAGLFRN